MKLSLELTVDTRPEWVDAVMADFRETPLQSATSWGHKEIAELLISKSADVNTKGKYFRKTPLDAAITFKHTEIADLLRKHGGKTRKELKAAGN